MPRLTQIIYSSAASGAFSAEDLLALLERSRDYNTRHEITGTLIHIDGSFLQVLEGRLTAIDSLFEKISRDARHGNLVTIIKESVPKRSFSDWSMGFADITREDIDNHDGLNDFFEDGTALSSLAPGRAKKLLSAFKDGRWRSRPPRKSGSRPTAGRDVTVRKRADTAVAFQPVVSASKRSIASYEVFVWDNRTQAVFLTAGHPTELASRYEEHARQLAMTLSAAPGSALSINLNVRPKGVEDAAVILRGIIQQAEAQNVDTRQITIELNQDYLAGHDEWVSSIVEECKADGLSVCLDDFGAGRSGLNQLEMSQPHSIALNEKLVRGIDTDGTKQAIVSGLVQTCGDVGADILAKHVETEDEFHWLVEAGIDLFQGRLFRRPALGTMPADFRMPE